MTPTLPKALEDRLQGYATQLRHGPVGRFFAWWWGELSTLLPAGWLARVEHGRRRLLLRVVGDEIEMAVHEAGDVRVLDAWPLDQDPGLQRQQIIDLLVERELTGAPRDLLLDADDVLRVTTTMPLAAESNLRQALAFDMDRQTPFRAEEVYFDYRVLERSRDSGQIRVATVVAPRSAVDQAVELLRRRGLPPSGVDLGADGAPAGFNLLPPERRQRIPNRQRRLNWALAGALVLALVMVMAQSLAWRRHQVDDLQARIDAVRDEALRVRRIREQIDDAIEAAGFMRARRAERLPVVAVIHEVTRVLPDDTYLERLNIAEGGVEMQGKSDDAQRLIELVNASPRLDAAAFRGPTRLDNRSGKEVFDLTANVEVFPEEGGDAAAP